MNKIGLLVSVVMAIGMAVVSCGRTPGEREAGETAGPSPEAKLILLFSGNYDVLRDGKVIGAEDFAVYSLESGNILVKSESVLDLGFKYQDNAEYYADRGWNINQATIKYHGGGLTRTMSVLRQGGGYSCKLSTGDGRSQEFVFQNASKYILGYGLSAFATQAIKKLEIKKGTFAEVPTILIESGSLKAFDALFRYDFLEEGVVEVPAGKFAARKFMITDQRGDYQKYLWVDSNGIVLCSGNEPAGNDQLRLSQYIRGEQVKSLPLP